jgi:hypothetical protein
MKKIWLVICSVCLLGGSLLLSQGAQAWEDLQGVDLQILVINVGAAGSKAGVPLIDCAVELRGVSDPSFNMSARCSQGTPACFKSLPQGVYVVHVTAAAPSAPTESAILQIFASLFGIGISPMPGKEIEYTYGVDLTRFPDGVTVQLPIFITGGEPEGKASPVAPLLSRFM